MGKDDRANDKLDEINGNVPVAHNLDVQHHESP
jgi:hypothetical protein